MQPHPFIHALSMVSFILQWQSKQAPQRPHNPQKIKYLQFCPLQKACLPQTTTIFDSLRLTLILVSFCASKSVSRSIFKDKKQFSNNSKLVFSKISQHKNTLPLGLKNYIQLSLHLEFILRLKHRLMSLLIMVLVFSLFSGH